MTSSLKINPYNSPQAIYAKEDLSNVSEKGRDFITTQTMPEYEDKLALSSGVFTPPVNGYINSIVTSSSPDTSARVYYGTEAIQTNLISYCNGARSSSSWGSAQVEVNKGEKYLINATTAYTYVSFIPMKGTN